MAATGTPTPNIGLRIPIGTDPASVDDINYNSNLIDTKLGAVGSDSVQDQIDTLNGKMTRKTTVSGTTTSSGALLVSIPTGGVVVSLDVTSEQGKIALKRSGSYIHIYTPNNNGLEPYVNANVSVDIYYQIP